MALKDNRRQLHAEGFWNREITEVRRMVSGVLEIQWYGPYPFIGSKKKNVFANPIWNHKGVYLWVIPFQNGFLTYYVGETGKSFADRHKQHPDCYVTGFYRVYDPEKFSKGNRQLICGRMWKPARKSEDIRNKFKNRRRELAPKISDFYLN